MLVQCACVVGIGKWWSFQWCWWWWWCDWQDHHSQTWSGLLTMLVVKGPAAKALRCANRAIKDKQEWCHTCVGDACRRDWTTMHLWQDICTYLHLWVAQLKMGNGKKHVFTSSNRAIIDDNLGVVVMTIHFTWMACSWINTPLKLISWLPILFVRQGPFPVFKKWDIWRFGWYMEQLKSSEWRGSYHL